jgi:hypothetical protein
VYGKEVKGVYMKLFDLLAEIIDTHFWLIWIFLLLVCFAFINLSSTEVVCGKIETLNYADLETGEITRTELVCTERKS